MLVYLYRYTWGARLERCPDGTPFVDFASAADARSYAASRGWSVLDSLAEV